MDESALTANALWEAVTGKPGTQTSHKGVHITCRSPESEAKRKADNDEYYGRIREESAKRKAAAKKEPITPAQLKYLTSLAVADPFTGALERLQVTRRYGAYEILNRLCQHGVSPSAASRTASKRLAFLFALLMESPAPMTSSSVLQAGAAAPPAPVGGTAEGVGAWLSS